jgi:hypothetical protein
MRNILFASTFILCINLTSCSDGQKPFPENINVTKTENQKRVKGTRLFVTTPAGYQPIESLIRLQKNEHTYFQVVEFPAGNFNEHKSKLTKEAIESQGAKVDIHKTVKYNGYDAIYMSGPSKTAGETKIGLIFGDDTFVMSLAGVCQTSDKTAIDELNTIISTSYYDRTYELNPLELVKFQFDESITGFKFATTMGNMFIYSPRGKADLAVQQDTLPVFMISQIEAESFEKAKEFLENTISRYYSQGVQLSNIKKEDVTINGNQAYEVTMDAKDAENKNAVLYNVIVYKGTSAVIFLGTDPKQRRWIDKLKATAHTIKM